MKPLLRSTARNFLPGLALAASLALAPSRLAAGDAPAAAPYREADLIAVLQSGAPAAEKAITCKRLAIYGSAAAVPSLAPLLANPELASWARIALEAIPGPAADAALRDALGRLQGRLLIGVINSIGYRRDPQATDGLTARLKDADPAVVGAAAVALGRIGTGASTGPLVAALAAAPPAARAEVAEGAMRCAEQLAADGNVDGAARLYDAVRKAEVPGYKRLEATRGLILVRPASGLPLLLELLGSPDRPQLAMGLRTARELPGKDVTAALVRLLDPSTPDRQALLLAVLGDRKDASVLPSVDAAGKRGPTPVRLAAVQAAERIGGVPSVAVLLDVAVVDDPASAQAARAALARLSGGDIDAEVLARLPQSSGRMRQALIDVAGQRRLADALPTVARSLDDPDPGVRSAALGTLALLGGNDQVSALVKRLEAARDPQDRAEIEKALLALSGRRGTSCLPLLLPLTSNPDPALRKAALHALASVGGPAALDAVRAAVNDKDEGVQDEAVRTLSTWANNWPEDGRVAEPLLALAKSGRKDSHRVLALRGYLLYLRGDPQLKDGDKVARVVEIVPILVTPESKQAALSILGELPVPGAVELLVTFAADDAVGDEACAAIVGLATGDDADRLPADLRRRSLQVAAEKARDPGTRKRAADALAGSH